MKEYTSIVNLLVFKIQFQLQSLCLPKPCKSSLPGVGRRALSLKSTRKKEGKRSSFQERHNHQLPFQ